MRRTKSRQQQHVFWATFLVSVTVFNGGLPAGGLNLGPEEYIQTFDALDIQVPGYSVPSLADLNGDGLRDLIIGEGSGSYPAAVRIYPNVGSATAPEFSTFSHAQSNGTDLILSGSGCLGLFPRAVDWDMDGLRDLLIGTAQGHVKVYLNTGREQVPSFDGGTFLQVGPSGAKTTIDVGARSTPTFVDWNNDDRKDLVIGALDGRIHLYLNEGTHDAPDFVSESYVLEDGAELQVPGGRSSPVVVDLNGDGRKDLLVGNTLGELLFYSNSDTDAAPSFSGYFHVESEGIPIDLPDFPRARPFVDDWTGDGHLDVLIGAGDGMVRLYQNVPEPSTLTLLALALAMMTRRRRE